MPRCYTKSGNVTKYEKNLTFVHKFSGPLGGITGPDDNGYYDLTGSTYTLVSYNAPTANTNYWLYTIYGIIPSGKDPYVFDNWTSKAIAFFSVKYNGGSSSSDPTYCDIILFTSIENWNNGNGIYIWITWGGTTIAKNTFSFTITGSYRATNANTNVLEPAQIFTLSINVVAGQTSNYSFKNAENAFYVGPISKYKDAKIVSATMSPGTTNRDGIYRLKY